MSAADDLIDFVAEHVDTYRQIDDADLYRLARAFVDEYEAGETTA